MMHRFLFIMIALVAGAMLVHAAPMFEPAQDLGGARSQESYGVGFVVGEEMRRGLEQDGVGADMDLVTKGFQDGLVGTEPLFDRTELDAILAAVHYEMEQRQIKRLLDQSPEFRKLFEDNLRKSDRFHELFGEQEGVVTLPNGLQYVVLEPGEGTPPMRGDTVVVSAKIKTLDGTVIRDVQKTEFKLEGIIEGGIETLVRMRPGARWQVAIPPALGHGAGGRFPDIGPNQTLVGTVELVEVKP